MCPSEPPSVDDQHGTAVAVPSLADAALQRWLRDGERLGDRYRPVRVLGQGGMGVVVHAVDERLGRDVAIKWLRPELARDPSLVTRFTAEAQALARVHHPNVVQILDIAEHGGERAYYVMEFLPGATLSSVQRDEGRLSFAPAYDVLVQTASALAAIHRVGVIHRDVKPSNLQCLELAKDSWHVKLIDFGIAIASGGPRMTRPGELVGTLPYMAPEQFAGTTIDARTDVYGWGVLALELLCGVSPMELMGPESLAGAPLRAAAAPALARARVQLQVRGIVQRCLETQPDDRWQGMDEVHAQLRALDDGGAPTLIFQRVPSRSTEIVTPEPATAVMRPGTVSTAPTLDRGAIAASSGTNLPPASSSQLGAVAQPEPAPASSSAMPVRTEVAAAQSQLARRPLAVAPRRGGLGVAGVAVIMVTAAILVGLGAGLWRRHQRAQQPRGVVPPPAEASSPASVSPPTPAGAASTSAEPAQNADAVPRP